MRDRAQAKSEAALAKAQTAELVAQQRLAESFIREQFKDAEGHNLRAYHSYRESVSFAQRLHVVRRHPFG
ncbi:MAG: hypothetical protein ACKV2Q_21755 [Planctomycetaceae bacterium]